MIKMDKIKCMQTHLGRNIEIKWRNSIYCSEKEPPNFVREYTLSTTKISKINTTFEDALWDMTPCDFNKNRRFGGTYSKVLKRATRNHMPEDKFLHCCRRESIPAESILRSYTVFLYGEAVSGILD
jgi:hypothetical protein